MSERFNRVTPSGLPTLETCPRRWAIQRDYAMAREAHPDLPEDKPSYKMVFGSAFHRVMELGKFTQEGVDEATDEVVGGQTLEYDAAYRNSRDMARGVLGAARSFLASPASLPWRKRGKKTKFEQKCEAEIEGIKAVGIVDCIDDGHVSDLKTTTPNSKVSYISQLTLYWGLARKKGLVKDDKDVSIVKVYRPRTPDGASGVKVETMSAGENWQHVRRLVRKAADLRDALPKWKGDYNRLAYNPNSGMCGYCPAKGTSACPGTRVW